MTITLGQLKNELRDYSVEHEVRFDCPLQVQPTTFGSWRGSYSELALGYEAIAYATTRMTVGALLDAIKSTDGGVYEGWKGGLNLMSYRTPVWIDNRGCYTSTKLIGTRFDDDVVLLLTEIDR